MARRRTARRRKKIQKVEPCVLRAGSSKLKLAAAGALAVGAALGGYAAYRRLR
jgi:hypothetical protein